MRKSLLALAAVALIPAAALAVPAATTTGSQTSATSAIDLDAIPRQPVVRHPAVAGVVADDESDDFRPVAGSKAPGVIRGERREHGIAGDRESGELE